jgi:hypothetical protein
MLHGFIDKIKVNGGPEKDKRQKAKGRRQKR